jgi:V/A-type H+/Na+-transporting ATPase subunit I
MTWREALVPARMERVAVVAPRSCLRSALVELAMRGQVELDPTPEAETATPAGAVTVDVTPMLAREPVDVATASAQGQGDLVAGELLLQRLLAGALERRGVAALTGWAPAESLAPLQQALAPLGAAVVRLAPPRGVDPPTRLAGTGRMRSSLQPLVDTYGTIPYQDLDPTVIAGVAYVVMFGMMFGDVGQGLLLVAAGLLLRIGRPRRLARFSRAWLFVTGAGIAATAFGFAYGELFGPTGVLTPLWLSPTQDPVQLLLAALAVGAVLLAVAYALGTINRWREGGWALALYAPSGVAGIGLFVGLGAVAGGLYAGAGWLLAIGVGVWLVGLALAFIGLLVAAGGGGAGAAQALVELFDVVLRVGTNLLSFARLAAFGLAHAAVLALVWEATANLWGAGAVGVVAGAVVFVVGNVAAFALEALVAAVQALRLEYYELFSRIFLAEGRPFRPWQVAVAPAGAPVEAVVRREIRP